MELPQDTFILLSYVNTKLRDEYPSLDELCGALAWSKSELEERLNASGYVYDGSLNKFC